MIAPAPGTYKWALIQEAHDIKVEYQSAAKDRWYELLPSICTLASTSRSAKWRLYKEPPRNFTVKVGTGEWAFAHLLNGKKIRIRDWVRGYYILLGHDDKIQFHNGQAYTFNAPGAFRYGGWELYDE